MKNTIQLLDTVAILKSNSGNKLEKGQVGTIVEILDKGVYEVEFCDNEGQTLAILALKSEDLLLLHYEAELA